MKAVKILLGTFFAAWDLGIAALGIKEFKSPRSLEQAVWEVAALLTAAAIMTLFSVWSFQSAFKKRAGAEDDSQADDSGEDELPRGPSTPDQTSG